MFIKSYEDLCSYISIILTYMTMYNIYMFTYECIYVPTHVSWGIFSCMWARELQTVYGKMEGQVYFVAKVLKFTHSIFIICIFYQLFEDAFYFRNWVVPEALYPVSLLCKPQHCHVYVTIIPVK